MFAHLRRIRQLCQVAAFRPRPPGKKGAVRNHVRVRAAVGMTALALPLIVGLVSETSASASTTPALAPSPVQGRRITRRQHPGAGSEFR
jgi:hypothetical protein